MYTVARKKPRAIQIFILKDTIILNYLNTGVKWKTNTQNWHQYSEDHVINMGFINSCQIEITIKQSYPYVT